MVATRPFAKKPASTLRLPQSCSFQDYVALLGNDGCDASHQAKKIRIEMKEPLLAQGPCGAIMRSMKVQVRDDAIDWYFLHPASLLHELTKRCSRLGDLVQGGGKARIRIYMDEIKPGNVLRPDHSRSVAMWYWTLMGLPSWYRSKTDGWFYFAAFPTKLVKDVEGGYSYLFARMMECFLELQDPFNFTTGFPCSSTSGMFLCQGGLEAVLSDEKALSQLWCLRGAAGTKPCCLCQNVVGRMKRENVAGHTWLVHYACSDGSKFAKHSSTSFQHMRDGLEALSGNRKECDKMGQLYGLVYKKAGILWHPSLKHYIDPTSQTFFDWMHILLASGGLGQYEMNEYLKVLQLNNVGLDQLDSFQQGVCIPKALTKLPKCFFAERICKDNDTHLRCFAGELLTAIPAMTLFNSLVLEPLGILRDHRLCFQQLATIIDILSKGEGALQFLPQLKRAISTHNEMFCKLYPNCAKPKFHWLFHIRENLEQFQVNMSCFCPERKHQAVKAVASHVHSFTSLMHHISMRIGWDTLQAFDKGDCNTCKHTHLDGSVRHIAQGAEMLSFWSDEVVCVKTARRLVTQTGRVSLRGMWCLPPRGNNSLSHLLLWKSP